MLGSMMGHPTPPHAIGRNIRDKLHFWTFFLSQIEMGRVEIASPQRPVKCIFIFFMPLSSSFEKLDGGSRGGLREAWHVSFDAPTPRLLQMDRETRQESHWSTSGRPRAHSGSLSSHWEVTTPRFRQRETHNDCGKGEEKKVCCRLPGCLILGIQKYAVELGSLCLVFLVFDKVTVPLITECTSI